MNSDLEKAKSEIRPLFGRGYIGGIDHKEQNQESKSSTTSKKLSSMEKAVLPSRSWREKNLNEMTDRDWRIFKEEFNITTRGGSIPHPIRFCKRSFPFKICFKSN